MYKKSISRICCFGFGVLSAAIGVSPAFADGVIQTQGKTCNEVQSELAAFEKALIYYPSKRNQTIILFDRFVSSGAFCPPRETVQSASVTSSDNPNCSVLQCQSPDRKQTQRSGKD
jgi:hypothetical protein